MFLSHFVPPGLVGAIINKIQVNWVNTNIRIRMSILIQFPLCALNYLLQAPRIRHVLIGLKASADFHRLSTEDIVPRSPGHLEFECSTIQSHHADSVRRRECRDGHRIKNGAGHPGGME